MERLFDRHKNGRVRETGNVEEGGVLPTQQPRRPLTATPRLYLLTSSLRRQTPMNSARWIGSHSCLVRCGLGSNE